MAGGEKVDMENAEKHREWMLSGISFQSADGGIRTRVPVARQTDFESAPL